MQEASTRLEVYSSDTDRYDTTLGQLLKSAAECIERETVVAELNERDLKRLQPRWEVFTGSLHCSRQILLHHQPLDCSGGVLIRSEDNRIRMDNTFEGRLERLEGLVLQVITERLFAAEISQRGLLNE